MGGRAGFQPAAHLEPVEIGHHHVKQNDVAFGPRTHRQRLGAIACGQHVEILGGQPCFQQLDVGGDVVDDQDTRGHRNFSYPINRRTVSMNLPTEIGLDR